jgi:ABC-type amino acid transport system permease subunit
VVALCYLSMTATLSFIVRVIENRIRFIQ